MNAFEELLQKIETAAKGIAGHYDDRVRIAAADIREALGEVADAVSALEGKAEAVEEPVPTPDPEVPAVVETAVQVPVAPSAPVAEDPEASVPAAPQAPSAPAAPAAPASA